MTHDVTSKIFLTLLMLTSMSVAELTQPLFVVLSQLIIIFGETTNQEAFCHNSGKSIFPLHQPEATKLPWVWEAVYDSVKSEVRIMAINMNGCHFDTGKWELLVHTFPQYASELGGGAYENVLVKSNLTSKQTPKLDVFGKTLTCTYYKSGERTVLATSQSLVVDSYKGHRAYASIIITCPNAPPNQTPNHQWDRISLDLLPVQEGDSRDNNGSLDRSRPGSQFSSPNLDASITYSSTTTGAFPVCHLPAYTTQAKKHKLSICTTINAVDNTAELIEWIEFHLMRGVDHIFLYNTALIPRVQLLVNATLSGYVEKGLITIVPWFYENCVKGMASGRSIEIILDDFPAWSSRYVKDNPDQKANSTSFLPPKPIAQTAALGSCYSRFRHTSEYIMHIDVDEFVLSRETSLPMFAEKLFKKSPHSVALSIAPVMMVDCNSTARGGDGLSQTDRKLLIQRLSRVAQAKDNLTATGAPSRPIQSRFYLLHNFP
jgi:hypothetical protein